jgi:glycosyltransferase involved in cell wall biosynthesis
MMRVLLVNTRHYLGGGDSTYTFTLADLLRAAGHEVGFFAMQGARNLPDPNADLFVSYVDFKEMNRGKSLRNGLRVLLRAIYSRQARHKFAMLLDRFKPDLVHLQNLHAHITPSILFEAKCRELPTVWTLHDYKLVCPNSHFLIDQTSRICEACGSGRYYECLLKRCKKGSLSASAMAGLEAAAHRLMGVRGCVDAYIAPSLFLRQKFIQCGFSQAQVVHLSYFIPEEAFACPTAGKGLEENPYILFMGKIGILKGVRELLAACRLRPSVRVVLAGDADEAGTELLRDRAPNAQWVGLKRGEELRRLLRRATALVLPSVWYENQPLSILEAFASGKPVVASRLGGMTELVTHGERGLLVPPGEPEPLSQALEWMLNHPEEAAEMGRKAYNYAIANFQPSVHYERIMALYTELIARGGRKA